MDLREYLSSPSLIKVSLVSLDFTYGLATLNILQKYPHNINKNSNIVDFSLPTHGLGLTGVLRIPIRRSRRTMRGVQVMVRNILRGTNTL